MISPPLLAFGTVTDDNSPAVVSVGTNGVADDAAAHGAVAMPPFARRVAAAMASDVPVFLGRVYVPTYVRMNCVKNWVVPCGKAQQISGNNRSLLPKNMKINEDYLCNVAKAIFYHASIPFDAEDLYEWVRIDKNIALISDNALYDIRDRGAHVHIADCINKILGTEGVIHAQTNMPCAWADVLRVSTMQLDMYLVVTKVFSSELEPAYGWILRGPSDHSLRVGFFDVNHGVFYPCNEVGTAVFVGTSYRRYLFKTGKRKGVARDLNLMMKQKGGMYPWLDAEGKPHYRVCAAAQIYRINRYHE